MDMNDLHQLQRGIGRISKQQFRNALKRSIGADKDYADGVFASFKYHSLGYLCNRNPQRQSDELVRVCMKLGEKP